MSVVLKRFTLGLRISAECTPQRPPLPRGGIRGVAVETIAQRVCKALYLMVRHSGPTSERIILDPKPLRIDRRSRGV